MAGRPMRAPTASRAWAVDSVAPTPYLDLVFNNYGLGEDDIGYPGRSRIHTDDSIQVKYYDKPKAFLDKAAFTVTADAGCEYGGGPAAGYYNPKGSRRRWDIRYLCRRRQLPQQP